MAQLYREHEVNPNEQESVFELLPAGEYNVAIVESSFDTNKKNTGMILKLTYQVIDGPFKERKIFENLSIEHENDQTRTIAQKALNSIGMAVGVSKIQDSAQLHNIPMTISVKVQPPKDGYGEQNRIVKHSAFGKTGSAQTPVTAKGSTDAGYVAPSPQSKSQPWAKK